VVGGFRYPRSICADVGGTGNKLAGERDGGEVEWRCEACYGERAYGISAIRGRKQEGLAVKRGVIT